MPRRDVAFELMEFLRVSPSLNEFRPVMVEVIGYAARYIRSLEDDKRHDAKLIRDLKRRGYCDERLRRGRGEEDPCAGCGCKGGAYVGGGGEMSEEGEVVGMRMCKASKEDLDNITTLCGMIEDVQRD